jgi:hypothetical protein
MDELAINELPIIELYSLEDLQRLALHQTLLQRGVQDPIAFLKENAVVYRVALKANVGLAITISSITPRKEVGQPRTGDK